MKEDHRVTIWEGLASSEKITCNNITSLPWRKEKPRLFSRDYERASDRIDRDTVESRTGAEFDCRERVSTSVVSVSLALSSVDCVYCNTAQRLSVTNVSWLFDSKSDDMKVRP